MSRPAPRARTAARTGEMLRSPGRARTTPVTPGRLAQDQVRRNGSDGDSACRPGSRTRTGGTTTPSMWRSRGVDAGVRGLRVLARSQLQGPRRGAREARRAVPGRRRPPERPDDGRAAVRQHPTGTPEPPLGAPRPLAVPLVDGHQGRGAHEGHEVAGAEGQEDGRRLPGERRGSSSTGSSARERSTGTR